MMTRKHYREVAQILHDEYQFAKEQDNPIAQTCVVNIMSQMATVFAIDNPRFDRQRFYAAAIPE